MGPLDRCRRRRRRRARRRPPSDNDEASSYVHIDPIRAEALSLGSRSANVRTVQVRLAVHGYATGVDGYWGPETDGKVRTFQAMKGLTVDGLVNVPGPDVELARTTSPPIRPSGRGAGRATWPCCSGRSTPWATPGWASTACTRHQPHQPDADRHPGWQGQPASGWTECAASRPGPSIDAAAAKRGYTVA